tara:strand:- start:1520 stop:1771 length:252 start_codon:yes stop_codon:yes gene_type:complete
MAKLIKADINIPIEAIVVKDLKSRQEIVGGYIEYVYLEDGKGLIVNEDGRTVGLPFNERATKLSNRVIVGDVILLTKKELKNE